MKDILNMISSKYLIGSQLIQLLEDGNILFIEDDGTKVIQNKIEFINDYIDFLTDLLEFNKQEKEYSNCVNILDDLKMLYEGLDVLKFINKQ